MECELHIIATHMFKKLICSWLKLWLRASLRQKKAGEKWKTARIFTLITVFLLFFSSTLN